MAGKPFLIAKIAEASGLTKTQSAKVIDIFIDVMQDALAHGEPVALSGFGTFRIVATKARKGRNPATGKPMTIPASKRVSFSSGTRLSAAVKESSAEPTRRTRLKR